MLNQQTRVIVNTIAQYVRTFLGIIIALFSTRIVLAQLGSNDFGLFSLIGSVLAFLSFFNTALTRSTQRFLSFYMGRADEKYQSVVLFNSILLNLIVSSLTALVMLGFEPVIFNGFLNISEGQIEIARVLYRMMIASIFFTINMTPFNAVFVSHENIVFSSCIYIIGAILKLVAALLLVFFSNKLLIYGLFLCVISIIEYLICVVCSTALYSEVSKVLIQGKKIDKQLLRSLLSFSSWNLYGTLCIAGRDQGYAVVINKFISLEANASFGIASQVSGQVNSFVYSIATSMSPVITKSEGAGDRERMIKYTISGSKISAILYTLIAFPLIFEINWVLSSWLGNPPEYSNIFVISIIVANLMDSISVGFRTGVQAIGKLMSYTLWFYTIKVTSILGGILLIKSGADVQYILFPYMAVELIGTFISVFFFAKYTGTRLAGYFKNIFLKIFPLIIASLLFYTLNDYFLESGLSRLVISFLIIPVILCIIAYYTALSIKEKDIFCLFLKKLIKYDK